MQVTRVHTESGSVYDLDLAGMRIRRLHGRHGPADTQPQDGIWRRFSGVEGLEPGSSMVVYWAPEAASGARETNLGFRTTPVRAITQAQLEADGALPET